MKHAIRFGAAISRIVAIDPAATLQMTERLAPDLVGAFQRAELVSRDQFRRLMGALHPTGIGALAIRPEHLPVPRINEALAADDSRAPSVVLEDPRHLGNLGAVVRVVAALGGRAVLTTGSVDPWHEAAIRGSAGLHFSLLVDRIPSASSLEGTLVAFDPQGADIRTLRLPDGALLAFGSERVGISDDLRQKAALLVRIPMRSGVSSMNLATSVAVGMFHWLSQPEA